MADLEKDVEAYFRDQVKKRLSGKTYKFRSVTQKGVTDRIAVLPAGAIWFVELKKVGGKLSPLQALHRDELEALGANWACLTGKAEVDQWIELRINDARLVNNRTPVEVREYLTKSDRIA